MRHTQRDHCVRHGKFVGAGVEKDHFADAHDEESDRRFLRAAAVGFGPRVEVRGGFPVVVEKWVLVSFRYE